MRWSLRLLVSCVLLAGLAVPGAAQTAPAPPTTSPAQFQRLLDTLVAAGAPGGIGSLEDDGHTIRRVTGVGNLRTGQPPRPVQSFRVASQTKACVSTIVLHGRRGRWWPSASPTGCCSRPARRSPTPTSTTWSPTSPASTRRSSGPWGALVSNVDDLDRFYDALFDARLLPRRLLAEMLVPVDTGVPGWGYGLG